MSSLVSNASSALAGGPLVLALNTVQPVAELALLAGETIIATRQTEPGVTASEAIFVALRALQVDAGIALSELHALAAVTGPGSFTGLRVGLATALGLSQALGIPVAGVTTLEALALTLRTTPMLAMTEWERAIVIGLLAAGRGDIYGSVRRYDPVTSAMRPVLTDAVFAPAVLGAFLAARLKAAGVTVANGVADVVYLCGDWAVTHHAQLAEVLAQTDIFPAQESPWQWIQPSQTLAVAAGRFVAQQMSQGQALAPLTPCYLRPPDIWRGKGSAGAA